MIDRCQEIGGALDPSAEVGTGREGQERIADQARGRLVGLGQEADRIRHDRRRVGARRARPRRLSRLAHRTGRREAARDAAADHPRERVLLDRGR